MGNESEVPLVGGRLNPVVRVGETVRRPTGPWTPTVHALLTHLRLKGFLLAPEPRGVDSAGREVLAYLPGDTVGDSMPWPDWVWSESLLAEVGRATAAYHEAVADFRVEGSRTWMWGDAAMGEGQVLCHNDLAPYNVVISGGHLAGIIDWDLVYPASPLSDLAFVAWQWVPLHDPLVTSFFGWRERPPDRGRRLRLLLDAYGLDDREGFLDAVTTRIVTNQSVIMAKAEAGDEGYVRLLEQGHVEGMKRALDFLAGEGDSLQAALDAS
jgi:hypothetical protein